MAKAKKKNRFFLILIICILAILVYRVILTHIIGSKGMAYFSVPNDLYFLLAISLGFGYEKAVDNLVENYMSRQQYENSKRVVKAGGMVALAIGLLISFVLALAGGKITGGLFGMPLSSMGLYCIIPAITLMALTGVMRGYFSGMNNKSILGQSYLIFTAVYLIVGSICSMSVGNYGQKVSALLKVDDFKFSYGAMGASVGILVASVVTFIHALVIFILMERRSNYTNGRDYSRSIESIPSLAFTVFINSLLPFALFGSVMAVPLINQILILKANKDTDVAIEFIFGEYYGKSFSIAYIIPILIAAFSYNLLRKAIGSSYKEEYREAREKLGRMIHRGATFGFFALGMLIVFADNILDSIFADNGANTVTYLQVESLSIIFAIFALMFTEILIQLGYINLTGVICLASAVIHIVITVLMVSTFKLSIMGAIIGNVIFFAVVAGVCFIIITRVFQYTQEWFRSFIVSLIGSGVSSLIGLFINKAIAPMTGKLISMVIVVLICLLVYIVILLALKGYDEDELEYSAPGRIMLTIGRLFNLI